MKNLQKLKSVLDKSKEDEVFSLCAVMEICGGYEQLLNLPIPALNEIGRYLRFVNKQNQKNMPKK